jgi:glycerol-3-phosphate dehydrogenase
VREDEVTSFITDLNQAFPALELTWADVSLVHRGVVPAVAGRDGSLALEGQEQVWDHALEGMEGLMSVAGTKYTTARAVAERVTNALAAKVGRMGTVCSTADTVLPGGDLGDVAMAVAAARHDYDSNLPSDTIPHLFGAYGSRFREVLEGPGDPACRYDRVASASPVIGAEIAWAARNEMALTLRDGVLRRTPLGALGHPGDAAAARAAAIMGAELGWSEERRRQELEALRAFYVPF